MPKKTTTIKMTGYRPFSTRRWQLLSITGFTRPDRNTRRIESAVMDDPARVGQQVFHDLPGILAPGSPLEQFLGEAFDIHLMPDQTFALDSLLGRRFLAKFGEPGPDGVQPIVAFKPYTEPAAAPATPPAVPVVMPAAGGASVNKPGGTR